VRDLLTLAVAAAAAWLLPVLATRVARPVVLNLGPNDADYVQGFRTDWERDVRTRFHWTTLQSSIHLPLHLRGAGHRLKMRMRRHFVEPARVNFTVEGRTAAVFEVVADTKVPYRIQQFDLPPLEGRDPFVLGIQSSSTNPRPLGVAIDWLILERAGPEARVALRQATRLVFLMVVLAAFALPRLAGLSWAWSGLHALLLLAGGTLGLFWDVVAAERILGEGAPTYIAVGLLALAALRWTRLRNALLIPSHGVAGILLAGAMVALAVRLVVLLHPQFYYPDVKVHALFAWQLARQGLVGFLQDFTVNQYRYSLGLQMENGHWYAFPYPPVFYLLTWPLVRLARYRPEVAVSLLGAAVNSGMVLLVFGIARRLKMSVAVGLLASGAAIVLPIYMARLALAYFPALVGHFMDMLVILYFLARLSDLQRPKVIVTLGTCVAAALLTYTQSLLNFGILLPLYLMVQFVADRSPASLRRAAGLIAAGALGAVLSLVLFYGRYVPIFIDMQKGIPMPEEQVLLDKLAQSPPADDKAPADNDDPYAGPGINPLRGLRKAAWRLYVFYWLFAPAVVAGIVLLYRTQDPQLGRFVLAWALTYLVLNLASGGLPGPNLVRYNKDLEIVAPLVCVALSLLATWFYERSRWLGLAFGAAFVAFGLARTIRYLTEKFVFEA
jgi:hypothetical protein